MQIIEVKNLDRGKWNDFVLVNKGEFLQSWEWGEFQESAGKKIWRLAIAGGGDEFLLIALLIRRELPLGKNYLYCSRGPVIKLKVKSEKLKVLESLFNGIKEIAKKENSVFFKWEPCSETPFPNVLGNPVSKPMFLSTNLQPHDTLILDLDRTEEELLAQMKQKTRYNMRLAEKHGVKIRVSDEKTFEPDFEKFWALTEETTARDKFQSHTKEYYRKMLEILGGGIFPNDFDANPRANFNKDQFKKDDAAINSLCLDDFNKGRIGMGARLFLAEFEGKILAANVMVFFGNRATYLYGASGAAYRNFMAPYLLQWEQIKKARETGFKEYDFWGIIGSEKLKIKNEKFKSENFKINSWQGITRFKTGFGGREINYPEAIDIVYQPMIYKAVKIVKKAAQIFRK